MSTDPTSVELNDSKCQKGQVNQQPPIPYAASKSSLLMLTTRETVKMKMPEAEGEHKQAILGDRAGTRKNMWSTLCPSTISYLLEKKGYMADLADAAKAVLKAGMTLKKYLKVTKVENDPAKAIRLTEVKEPKSLRAPSRALPMTSSAS